MMEFARYHRPLDPRMSELPASLTTDFVLQQALQLPIPDRIELMQRIGDSLEAPELSAVSAERAAELRRRVKHLQSHPEDRLTWDEVEAAVRQSRS